MDSEPFFSLFSPLFPSPVPPSVAQWTACVEMNRDTSTTPPQSKSALSHSQTAKCVRVENVSSLNGGLKRLDLIQSCQPPTKKMIYGNIMGQYASFLPHM